ncbi:MAG: YARHG domain-containing protein [Spirochaetes bacterium]|nr:YARHG domain-containing protein [Spirochaetota bacterium]
MKKIVIIILLLAGTAVSANDGAFFASGNQLIPVAETNISIKSEILTISWMDDGFLKVYVDYVFFNPGKSTILLTGFEAPSPNGDVDGTPVNGKHPYIMDFSVNVNGSSVKYDTAIVTEKNYYSGNRISSKTVKDVVNDDFNENYPEFYYVYYFNADFKKGFNRIRHEYKFRISGSVYERAQFDYILTAANRWAGEGIEDFTLILNMPAFETVSIRKTFFKDASKWETNGRFQDGGAPEGIYADGKFMRIYSRDGYAVFREKNFNPDGELNLHIFRNFNSPADKKFNYLKDVLPFSITEAVEITGFSDEISRKILRNLPFAMRGYVFNTEYIQKYYNSIPWYLPDDKYSADMNGLTLQEKRWITLIDEKK